MSNGKMLIYYHQKNLNYHLDIILISLNMMYKFSNKVYIMATLYQNWLQHFWISSKQFSDPHSYNIHPILPDISVITAGLLSHFSSWHIFYVFYLSYVAFFKSGTETQRFMENRSFCVDFGLLSCGRIHSTFFTFFSTYTFYFLDNPF